MRGLLWPLLGAVSVPGLAWMIARLRTPDAIASVDPANWLMLAGLGAVAGVVYFIKARLLEDRRRAANLFDGALARATRNAGPEDLDRLQAAEDARWAVLRREADHGPVGAHRYRVALEVALRDLCSVEALLAQRSLDTNEVQRKAAHLRAELDWVRPREGIGGRWLA